MSVSRRRFSLLAAVLVALNLALWVVPQGIAMRQAVVNQLFGARMIRAEVVVQGAGGAPVDYRVDRGVIASATSTAIVLREQDGTTVTIPLGATTSIIGGGHAVVVGGLRRNLRVLVIRHANGPAEQIQVEGRGKLLP
jgi:hypothetical protein